jgi:hypothetical protein
MTRWDGKLFERNALNGHPARRRARRAAHRRFLPFVDAMEGRALLSTLTVQSNQDSGPGSLRATIAAASSGDTIEFASSIHNITLTSDELAISMNLTIEGSGSGRLTISGNDANRVFEISNKATVTIEDLTVANGAVAGENGGGILVDPGASLALTDATVSGNSAYADSTGYYGSGGGVENDGSLTVTASTFTNNLCSGGDNTDPTTEGSAGGAIDSQGPALTVTTSTFKGNQAVGPSSGNGEGNGGAINNSSTATITYSTFSGNHALGRTANGGAISAGESELVATPPLAISNCTFTGNQALAANGANDFTNEFGGQALGGAIDSDAALSINNSAFTENLAQGGDEGNNASGVSDNNTNGFVGLATGGGVCDEGASLAVADSTFTGNQAIGGNSATGVGGLAAGGAILSAGFSTTNLTSVTLLGNQAVGGIGGPGSPGGSSVGGGFYSGIDATATVSNSHFSLNLAQGGTGGSGAAGGIGAGGAIGNGGGFGDLVLSSHDLGSDVSSLVLDQSTLTLNVAQGGAGGSHGTGGSGQGGGCYVPGSTTATIDNSKIVLDAAVGGAAGAGGSSGQGTGGGLFIGDGAAVTLSSPSEVVYDYASSSDDDIFGTYTI